MDGYNLSLCSRCGGAYADGIPSQSAFDRYYSDMSKYERSLGSGDLCAVDKERYRETADMIVPGLRPFDAVVDVGCATGALLSYLKRRGFTNLLGIDPSSACAAIGKRLYGIPIRNMNIGRLIEITERFDTAILTGVLEHLCDVDTSLNLVLRLLKPGGQLYIEVPDASRYYKHFSAPFQFLSMEHINYFSPISLSNLMARQGLTPVFIRRVLRPLSSQAIEPTIAGLFRRSRKPGAFMKDLETESALEKYLKQSKKLEKRLHARISNIVDSKVPLVVWGTGTHTLRLLKTSRLGEANILKFIDSNMHYQEKKLEGRTICSPEKFRDKKTEILISSHVSEKSIYETITQKLRWPNRVHRLYADGL